MIKFVVLLTSAITFNFTISFGEYLGISESKMPQEIQLVFSEEPIGFEGGQPIYPSSTKVVIKAPAKSELTIVVNGGKEFRKESSEVDITDYIGGRVGTHTVLVESKDRKNKKVQKIFGFSTK